MYSRFTNTAYEDLIYNCVFSGMRNIFFSLHTSVAAMVIQACWRGYVMRRQYLFSTKLHTASTGLLKYQPNSCIKHETILKKGKRENAVNIQEQKEKAAILIQVSFNLLMK